MPKPKQRNRKPELVTVHWHDAMVSFSQSDANDPFWRAFIFLPALSLLKRKGWKVSHDPDIVKNYPNLADGRRIATKGNLEAWIECHGRSFEVSFNTTEGEPENPNGHKYGFDKFAKMSRIDQRRFLLIRRDLIRLVERKTKIEMTDRAEAMDVGKPLNAIEKIEHGYRTGWHSDKVLGRPKPSERDATAKDGGTIEQGATVWVADHKGRIIRGTAMIQLGSRWWVVQNKTTASCYSNFELFTSPPDDLRRKRNDRMRRIKLEKQLALATQRMDFARAELLKKLLFQDEGVYLIWARDKDAYYRSQYNGYTGDKIHAGKYLKCEAEAECRRVPHELSMVTPEGKHVRFDQE